MDVGTLLLGLGVALVLGGQALSIASWWLLSRLTLDVVQETPRLMVPFLATFGMAAATKRTRLGAAVVARDPERGPSAQRRFRGGLALTLLGVLVAFGGLAL